MIVFDSTLDTFRFAHLSVREFLEKRPEYASTATNSLAAETCLLKLLSAANNPATKLFFSEQGQLLRDSMYSHDLCSYSTIYWARHCQLAAGERTSGVLRDFFLFFLSNELDPTSAFALWTSQLQKQLRNGINWELYERLRDTKSVAAATLFVACSFDFPEIIRQWAPGRPPPADSANERGLTALQVAVTHGSCKAISVLITDEVMQITEEVVKAAAGNRGNGKEILTLLLDQRGADVRITEEVVKTAARNQGSGKEILTLLFNQRGADVQITEEVVKAAAGNWNGGKEVMTLLFDRRGADIEVTEEVVKAAAGNQGSGKEVLTLLLDQRGADVQITEEVVKTAAGNWNGGKEVMALLFDRRGADIEVTEEVVKAAAGNQGSGKEILTFLLKQRGADVQITEEVVKSAARNWGGGKEVLTLLLNQRGADIQITEEIVILIAGNFDKEVVMLLLDRRGADIQITEEIVMLIAGNFDKEVMTLLLDRQGADIQVVEEIAILTAWNFDKEIITLLHNRKGADAQVREEVVKAAAGNWSRGKEVMAFLLDRRGGDIKVTEEVAKAAAGNQGSGKEILTLLLNQRGADVQITEEVVKAAAGNQGSGKEVLTLLLDQRGADVQITEGVVKTAVGNEESGREVTTILLNRRGADIQITEEVVKAAVRNEEGGKEVMMLLLDRRGVEVQVTEDVVKAAAENCGCGKEIMTLLLNQRRSDVQITVEVVKAAAENCGCGKEVMMLLLDRRGADVQITEEIVMLIAGNFDKEVMALLLNRRGANVSITAGVVKAAAENLGSGKEVMALLLDQRGADFQVTKEIGALIAAHEANMRYMTSVHGRFASTVLHRRNTTMFGANIVQIKPQRGSMILPQTPQDAIPKRQETFSWFKGQLIGKGTFGRVYLGMNAITGELLAVKQVEVCANAAGNDREKIREIVTALGQEIDTMQSFDHVNIVQCLGCERKEMSIRIFLEYISGRSIGSRLKKHGKFEEPVVSSLTRQTLSALAYLHREGIIHGDLKADNILLDLDGTCKISCFGISKKMEIFYGNDATNHMHRSVFWMAPEVVRSQGQGYFAKMDIWSLGCVVLEMFTGRRPWSKQDTFRAIYKLGSLNEAPPIPDNATLNISLAAVAFMASCFTM